MSTAVDTGLEALLSGDALEPEHLICVVCYPRPSAPAGAVVLCGVRLEAAEEITKRLTGRHKCARCIQVNALSVYPCGH